MPPIKTLVADDVAAIRELLARLLEKWGYHVQMAEDGQKALDILRQPDPPQLAIVDWMMPHLEGIELCRQVRSLPGPRLQYLIILTGRDSKEDVAAALEAGADDYITKPFSDLELHARLKAGERIIRLSNELSQRLEDLQRSMQRVNMLEGLLPICAYCKRIRDERESWHEVENYIQEHSSALFTHGICPTCFEAVMGVRPT